MNIGSIGQHGALTIVPTSVDVTAATSARASATEVSATSVTNAPNAVAPPASGEKIADTVKNLNDVLTSVNSNLQFSVDDDTGRTVVKIVDTATDQIIKQIPSEEILAVAKAIDQLKGVFIKQQA